MGRLDDKAAIVTGGTRGIGRAIAERFAQEGAHVVVAARDEPATPFSHTSITHYSADVSKVSDVAALVDFTMNQHGRFDILVNNAGVELEKGIEDTSEEEWDWLMSINLKGVFLCCKSAIPHMRRQGGGSIINIGSYDGFQADPDLVAYCASKGGVHALSRAIAVDHGKDGIRCNVICPGWIKTDMMKAYLDSHSDAEDSERLLIAQHPIGRVGQPTDIANLALWLASDESSFATGQLFVHDGGLTAHAPYVHG